MSLIIYSISQINIFTIKKMSSDSEPEIDDNEFWEDSLESEQSELESPIMKTEAEFYKSLTIQNKLPPKFLFRAISLRNKTPLPYTQESINQIREENKLVENIIRQEVKSKTRQELKAAVEEINAEFEKEIHVIRVEHDFMKDEIAKKNREIALLGKFMIDQEVVIAQNRLSMLLSKETAVTTPALAAEFRGLKGELNILKVQIEGMKEATTEYSNQTSAAAAKLKDLDTQIEGIRAKHREELKIIEVQMLQKVEEAKIEREKVKKAFENYKSSGWQSLEDTEGSVLYKSKLIEQLKTELKLAKDIIKHPKLKLRVHEKLEDYVKEYELDDEEDIALRNSKEKNSTNKIPGLKTKYRKNNQDFGTRFTSFCSDTNTAYSKMHTRRSTVTDGFRTRLSPI